MTSGSSMGQLCAGASQGDCTRCADAEPAAQRDCQAHTVCGLDSGAEAVPYSHNVELPPAVRSHLPDVKEGDMWVERSG